MQTENKTCRVTQELTHLGWEVARFWEKDIQKNVKVIAQEVAAILRKGLSSSSGN